MRRFVVLGLAAAAMVVLGLVVSLQADIVRHVDFSTSPTTVGFTKGTGANYVDPDTMLDTGAGTWNVNLLGNSAEGVSDGQKSSYAYHSLVSTLTEQYAYGDARVAFQDGSANLDDRTLVFMSGGSGSAGYAFSVAFAPGKIIGYGPGTYLTPYSFNVSNNDGQAHTYSWRMDKVNKTLSLKFDGASVGSVNVAGNNWAGEDMLYFGDGTGGAAHTEAWDYWQIGSTSVPEPSTIILLECGVIGLVCYAWRKRR